ncbi:MAG: FGGY family carbohydrate kinase [Ilumatobacteraceae bacterium]|nr:FGGY family carbohydrate kinase [Ilumatobacteraceae bacterium]
MTAMPEREIILCLDQGTTNTKAIALDRTGSVVAEATEHAGLSFPRPGWVESDAAEIWRATASAAQRCLIALERPHLVAVAVANQRESAVIWDRSTGEPLGPVVSWQCGRSQPLCERLAASGSGERIRRLSGLSLSPMFAAGKMAWLLDQVPDGRGRAAAGEICLGTVDSWILWNLTGGRVHATDLTNASRTQLLDLATLQWSDELLEMFSIARAALPEVFASAAEFGAGAIAELSGVPVCAVAGDSHASLVAHGALRPGSVKATFGTGTSVLAPVADDREVAGLSRAIGWSRRTADGVEAIRALEGNIYATGAALDCVAGLTGTTDDFARFEREATADRGAAAGVYFVPALSGLGAPHWDATATGTIVGLTRGSVAGDLARAAYESIAFQVRDVLDALPPSSAGRRLHVDGGAMRSDLLASLVADVTGMVVVRPTTTDLSAVGVGYLAGHQIGWWPSLDDVDRLRPAVTEFRPAPDRDWELAHARWGEAVERSRGWNTNEVPVGADSPDAHLHATGANS